MNKTTNYKLNQWEAGDRVLRTDFNADNAKIDAAIKAVDQKADGKAAQSALNALQTAVNAKGNCQIVTGKYTGTGKRGSANPNTLTFDKKPVLLLVSSGPIMISARGGNGYIQYNGGNSDLAVVWGDKSVSWFCDTIDSQPDRQMNTEGVVYTYVVFLEA